MRYNSLRMVITHHRQPQQITLLSVFLTTGLAVSLLFSSCAHASDQTVTVNQQVLSQLQETVRQQQLQLQQQAVQIQRQAELLQRLEQQLTTLGQQTIARPVSTETGQSKLETGLHTTPPPVVSSGNNKVKLAVSGQINRALNVVSDGGRTSLYHVDNNVSNSRFRLVGTAPLSHDLTLDTRLEMAFTADESSKVSQLNQAPGNYLNARWADISLTSKTYGKLSLGKGNTASYLTAASDFSQTDIILYSSVADIAGGLFFRKKSGGLLTDRTLADQFTDYDGLNVKSRLRYDSPTFMGFRLAGSLVSNQRSDLGLHWGGKGYGFQAAAGFGLANPKLPDSGLQYDGSFSLIHTDSGLNLTISSGKLEKQKSRDAYSYYGKLGWLANLTKLGPTAFGVDYSRSDSSVADGDRGISLGAAVVQEFRMAATELYLQYRIYSLKPGDGIPLHDINVGTLGVRVKF